jgi:hypothetical protein
LAVHLGGIRFLLDETAPFRPIHATIVSHRSARIYRRPRVMSFLRPFLVLAPLLAGTVPAAAEDLVARWQRADAACALPASPLANQACEDRDRFATALRHQGWCEARASTAYDHWGWQLCAPVATARAVTRRRARPHA